MSIVNKFTNDLILEDGIFFSKKSAAISYPESGNEHCFQIEQNSFWFNHRNNCITEAVKKYSHGEIFIDIGGGNGYVSKKLEDEGINTILIEPGITGCLNAKNRGLKNIVCSNLENAGIKNSSIHAAGLFDVVEHIEDDHTFLKDIYRYVAPSGKIFITVPAYNFLWSKEDIEAGHFRRYTIKVLNGLLEKTGFTLIYSTYIFSILPLPVFLFRSLPSMLGLKKDSKKVSEYAKEHQRKKGVLNKALDVFWRSEVKRIENGKKIPFGGSCFVVAEKK